MAARLVGTPVELVGSTAGAQADKAPATIAPVTLSTDQDHQDMENCRVVIASSRPWIAEPHLCPEDA
ncbi:hypothetical protein [Pseudonocardia yunnanensis]|uniref:Uncharacterized protein n=1 Tax=Pseudonocardia yunnanensis TaxID=58107 RepID=A0ABW4EWE6_9PSEU